jgi:hypothetical protein
MKSDVDIREGNLSKDPGLANNWEDIGKGEYGVS